MTNASHDNNNELDRARELGHEMRDASMRAVTWAGVGLMALVAIALAGAYMFNTWMAAAPSQDAADSVTAPLSPMFDAPRANQSLIREQQQTMRRAVLDSYAWIDQDQGVARIPIKRAIELISGNEALLQATPLATPPETDEANSAGNQP